jgi:hypothetical protein
VVGYAGVRDVRQIAARALLRAVPEWGQVGIWPNPKPAHFILPMHEGAFGLQ